MELFKSDQTGSGLSTLALRPGRCEILTVIDQEFLTVSDEIFAGTVLTFIPIKKYYYIFMPAYPNKI